MKPKSIARYMLKYWPMYLFVFFAVLVVVTLDAVQPYLIRLIVDDVMLGGETGKLLTLLLLLCAAGCGRALMSYFKELTSDRIGIKLGTDMRRDLFGHIIGLNVSYFSENNTGELMARVKDDIDRVWFILGFAGMLIFEAVMHTIITIFRMLSVSPLLTLIPIVIMISIAAIAVLKERKLDAAYGALSEKNAEMTTIAQENLTGVRTVKAFSRESFEIDKFEKNNEEYYDLNMKLADIIIKYDPYIGMFSRLLIIGVVVVGGLFIVLDYDEMTLGKLTEFVGYANGIIWPMECAGWLCNEFASSVASRKKIKKILSAQPEIVSPEQPEHIEEVQGRVEFDDVSFSVGETKILSHVSFTTEPGKTTGIMGMTGSGKSTIVNLMERFYDVTEGAVKLDGVDVRKLSLDQLRENVSVVMQDVFLFSDSIEENIKLGSGGSLEYDEMCTAAKAAGASEFIDNLGQKYETIIGERGVGLSGGQKQRISIARAFSKKAPILILDDATSALDMETEYEIQQSLKTLGSTTKLIIAHRISAVKDADEIIILSDGEIAERGTHAQLMEKRGLYFATYVAQYNTEVDMVERSEQNVD